MSDSLASRSSQCGAESDVASRRQCSMQKATTPGVPYPFTKRIFIELSVKSNVPTLGHDLGTLSEYPRCGPQRQWPWWMRNALMYEANLVLVSFFLRLSAVAEEIEWFKAAQARQCVQEVMPVGNACTACCVRGMLTLKLGRPRSQGLGSFQTTHKPQTTNLLGLQSYAYSRQRRRTIAIQ
jgi:hypothetical protein